MSEASLPKPPSETQPDVATAGESPPPKAPPQAEEAPATDEPPAETEEKAENAAKPKTKAKQVTAKVLRAAARSTADIKDIVAAEARVRKKKSDEQSSVFALAQEMNDSGTGKIEEEPAAAQSRPQPEAKSRTDQPASRPTQAASAPTPAPATQIPRAAQDPVWQSPTTGPSDAPSRAISWTLIALAASVFAAGLMVAWSTRDQSNALRALADHRAEPTPGIPVPAALPALPPALESSPRAGALAEVGAGRVVYADGSGRLVVLRRDPTSAELEVERVYELARDEGRGQGQPDRHYHGYYLDDVEEERKAAIETARARYEAAVTLSARTYTNVDEAENAAIALVAAGGADRLVEFLAPEATALRRRTAVVGLAEGGYLCAVEPLLGLLQDHVRNTKFFARLTGLASRLTSQELDPSDPEVVLSAVRAWMATNTNRAPFARVKGS